LNQRLEFCDLCAAHAMRAAGTEAALLRVARSGRYVLGEEVQAFELESARTCGTPHAVGVGSGTDAIALTLRAAGIGPGDEVVVPAHTAAATWMAVAQVARVRSAPISTRSAD
jgi:dTDP-3-amino-3,4,6-trideoxy-alpha-D-glucose transaminase